MTAYPVVKSKEVIAALKRNGFCEENGHGDGGHVRLVRDGKAVSVPTHGAGRVLSPVSLRILQKKLGLNKDQFVKLISE